ncbi:MULTISPECIES: DUF4949 domain-containing protein [Legionella]|uniref:Hemin binding protein n=1 Tax=Legionella drozanskii LLAP-1 TaxID=1212489 RepID=A0A0W0SUU6_9GAMM|nr:MULTISPECIES: DUF4949 domain-containing protein [Legionella]KTC87147.1 hemin binding protein [Legionella drozanskii LLAP-1]PJE17419.1 MAG: hypothetical protein CK430_02525 [Legionella sp.]
MKLKAKLLSLISALVMTSSAFAAFEDQGPKACPSVSAIKAEGVSMALEFFPKIFLTYQFSDYGTSHNWFFAVGFFKQEKESDAIAEGKKSLVKLTGSPKPLLNEEGYWLCDYEIGEKLAAVAIYADLKNPLPLMKQFFQKLS